MTPRALIVDDSLTVRMDLSDALEGAGFEAVQAATLAAARRALRDERIDLVVLDVILPDGDGLTLLEEIRSAPQRRTLPVMLLTSETEVSDRIRGLLTGASEYVGKPYDTSYVIGRATELIRTTHAEPTPPAACTVLLVDDSQTFREELKDALEAEGFRVTTAETGEEALHLIPQTRPDMIIVDGMLPGIDGSTVIRRIKLDAALRSTPCALLTASEEREAELQALDAGADTFLRKTDDTGAMLARLAPLLRQTRTASEAGSLPSVFGPKRILAVDDSPTYLNELSSELREEGYDVIPARSGEEALRLLALQEVDCILLDLIMPGLSGHETCRRIKALPSLRDVPLVMLTALDERQAMVEGINAGADDYIAKSSDFEVLKARLRAQLRRKQFEDENRKMRERLLRQELEATEARAEREVREARAEFLADLERKNEQLARINTALHSAKERAERESRFKSKFLASMSHELRTPLNAILGFSELLEQELFGGLQPKQKQFVGNVLSSGRHLLTLINDILDLSKVEAGKMELRCEWTPLDVIVDAVKGIVVPLSHARGNNVEIDISSTIPALYVDPVRIKQVLYNLLSNAIKFTSKGGHIRLTATASYREVRIAVSDDGVGIRQEDLPRLFREFEQLDTESGRKGEGTGLGLALTKRLVTLHGGTVTVESEPGKGSTFTVSLPLLRRPGGRSSGDPVEVGASEPIVLVVEDEPDAAELIAGYLHCAGLTVAFASNAEEAVQRALALRPAAITLDILMPDTDGWWVLAELKGRPETATIPVVVVSVVDQLNRGLIVGANDYLIKPITRESLLSSVEALGVALHRVEGRHILLVGHENGELRSIEAYLRGAGCQVIREEEITEERIATIDLILMDLLARSPARGEEGRDDLVGRARQLGIPVLGLFDPARAGSTGRGDLERLAWTDALRPERLIRAVWQAVTHDLSHTELWHGPTGLPSRAALRLHLHTAIQRAEREIERVSLLCVEVPIPTEPVPVPWGRLLRPALRPGDFLAIAGEGLVGLVVFAPTDAVIDDLTERLTQLLRATAGIEAGPSRSAAYPGDGASAEELLARCSQTKDSTEEEGR